MKILIATTNSGKYKEIIHFLGDLPFEFLSLGDLKKLIKTPEETESTLEQNAILKAKYYAKKSGLITIAEDTGLFIDALKGWPGLNSARVGNTSLERCELVLDKMRHIVKNKRTAQFKTVFAVYNPKDNSLFTGNGEVKGIITDKKYPNSDNDFGYNRIFYVPAMKKVFSAMTIAEKNSISQRGKALTKIKYFLQNQFGAKHIVVPCALIIENGKLLITLRNDPHRKESHKKWEFPGGIVDFAETVESTIIKEVKEEVNLDVKIIKQLQKIAVKDHKFPNFNYQVYLIPIVCKIIGGKLKPNDAEVLDAKWIKPEDHVKYQFLPGDKEYLKKLMPELLKTIYEYDL